MTLPPIDKKIGAGGDRWVEFIFSLPSYVEIFGKEAYMAAKPKTYQDLMEEAKKYGVDNNALFVQAAEQYSMQFAVIQQIKRTLQKDKNLITSKEYVKGRENVCAHPLIRELPKHVDSANKTLGVMLEILTKLGKPPAPEGKLAELMRDA